MSESDGTAVPACHFRELTEHVDVFFCRHSQVHVTEGLVSPPICKLCSMREKPCLKPRTRTEADRAMLTEQSRAEIRPILRPPTLIQQGWNVTQALAAFTADGFKTVTAEEYAERLAICDSCDKRQGTRCMQCGCGLTLKARGRAFQCPLKRWPNRN